MNERIRELATEVGISVDYLTNTKQIVLLEKFAELIVRECVATIANDTANYPGEGMMAYYQGVQDAGKSIKQHFGVEE